MPPVLGWFRLADGKEPESVRPSSERNGAPSPADLRRLLGGLDGLPLRPLTARAALATLARPETEAGTDSALPRFLDTDPGWNVAAAPNSEDRNGLQVLVDFGWWATASEEANEARERLWRHAVATSSAARRLAVEAERDDASRIARAALLNQLGLWAFAAVAPEILAEILSIPGPRDRRIRERELFGKEANAIGRDLAERWGCGPLVADAAWLHLDDSGDLSECSQDPDAIRIIQKAFRLAERTPWAILSPARSESLASEPRLRILIAEVQVRCAADLLDVTASEPEESLTRSHARLLIEHDRLKVELAARDRLLSAIADHDPSDSPEVWAERAALAWCAGPGVTSAQVIWDNKTDRKTADRMAREHFVALDRPNHPGATVKLRSDSIEPASLPTLPAWQAFAGIVADRDRQVRRLDAVMHAHREHVDREAIADRTSKLEALAEFAAGAGHELNNPLAVILGRAQLLLPMMENAEGTRSLRVIIAQAQRAHRILRDLMYVARPPVHRPRPCQPDEIIRACLRDFKDEAEARGVKLISEVIEPVPVAWADPDPLRHTADLLIRNALESTPTGGTIRVLTGREGSKLQWTVKDTGRGISATEGTHLFDPFFCGRQAGRGLGLGLSRVARFVSRSKGELSWRSTPSRGATFSVTLPIDPP